MTEVWSVYIARYVTISFTLGSAAACSCYYALAAINRQSASPSSISSQQRCGAAASQLLLLLLLALGRSAAARWGPGSLINACLATAPREEPSDATAAKNSQSLLAEFRK